MDKSFGYHCIHRYRTTHVECDDFFVETDVMIVPLPADFWSLSSTAASSHTSLSSCLMLQLQYPEQYLVYVCRSQLYLDV